MQQGSNLNISGVTNPLRLAAQKQAIQFQTVQEVAAVCSGIQHIATYCVDQGHVTLEQIDDIAKLANLMRAKLMALGVDIAN